MLGSRKGEESTMSIESIQSAEGQNDALPPFQSMRFFQKSFKRAFTPPLENRKCGFGLFPISRDVAPLRASAVAHMLELIDRNEVPVKTADNLMAMAVVRQVVGEVFLEGSFDWFTTSYHLGQPSGRLALQASRSLAALREHVVSGAHEQAERAMDDLARWAVPEMLDTYLLLDGDPETDEIEDAVGWAYMLWTPDRPGQAAIGVTKDTIMDEIENLQADYPGLAPFGVLSAWQVVDPDLAATVVENELMFAYTGEDVFHELAPHEDGKFEILAVKERIETSLVAANQLVLSPWHLEEQIATEQAEEEAAPSHSM
jgi:hypothetical protein